MKKNLFLKGVEFEEKLDFEKALECFYQVIEKDTNHREAYIKAAMIEAKNFGRFDKALELLDKSIQIAIAEFGDRHENIIDVYTSFAQVHRKKGEFDVALEYYVKVKSIADTIGWQDTLKYAHLEAMIAEVYHDKNDLDTAFEYFQKSKKLFDTIGFVSYTEKESIESFNNTAVYAVVLQGLSGIYEARGDFKKAKEYQKMRDAMLLEVMPGAAPGLELRDKQKAKEYVMTGFESFDDITGGLRGGDLIILASRPSIGKTALAISIAMNVAKKYKNNEILFFSLEMSDQELAFRLLSVESEIPFKKIQDGKLADGQEWTDLAKAAGKIGEWNIIIDDTPFISVDKICSTARKISLKHNINFIIIDHLGLVEIGTTGRYKEIQKINVGLKQLAKEINIPIILLEQVSRRSKKRPSLNDIPYYEAEADIITILHREKNTKKVDYEQAEWIIAKNRRGATKIIQLNFDAKTLKFSEMRE